MGRNMIPLGDEVPQVLRTKQCLYEAFFRLLEGRAYEDITVGQICKKADYSRAVFYNHYHSKEEFFEEIFDRIIELYHQKLEKAERENRLTPEYSYKAFLKILLRNKEFFILLEKNGIQNLLVNYFMKEPDRLYLMYSGDRAPNSEDYHEYFLRYHAVGLAGICLEWIKQDEPMPLEEFVSVVEKLYGYKQLKLFLE